MSRPVIPPPPLRRPVPPGLWCATPPVIFPSILGLFALGLGWRQALAGSAFAGLAETLLGAVTLLYLFAATAYVAKPLRRPGVLAEEVRVLPGRAGLATAVMSMMLLSAVLVPYAPRVAAGMGLLAFGLHSALAVISA